MDVAPALREAVPGLELGEVLGLPRPDTVTVAAASPEHGPLVVKLQPIGDRRPDVAATEITGAVDWDELGFGTRASDLVGLAYDCAFAEAAPYALRLLERAQALLGEDAVRVLFAYFALGRVAVGTSRGWGGEFRARDVAAGLGLLPAV
jgi:hypothetical protein